MGRVPEINMGKEPIDKATPNPESDIGAAKSDSRETRAYSQRAQEPLQLYILYYT